MRCGGTLRARNRPRQTSRGAGQRRQHRWHRHSPTRRRGSPAGVPGAERPRPSEQHAGRSKRATSAVAVANAADRDAAQDPDRAADQHREAHDHGEARHPDGAAGGVERVRDGLAHREPASQLLPEALHQQQRVVDREPEAEERADVQREDRDLGEMRAEAHDGGAARHEGADRDREQRRDQAAEEDQVSAAAIGSAISSAEVTSWRAIPAPARRPPRAPDLH
jgi:hypothetical protein